MNGVSVESCYYPFFCIGLEYHRVFLCALPLAFLSIRDVFDESSDTIPISATP